MSPPNPEGHVPLEKTEWGTHWGTHSGLEGETESAISRGLADRAAYKNRPPMKVLSWNDRHADEASPR
jgi:hypothetical protein